MIEFLEEPHIYLVDGVETPSVTQIVRSIVKQDLSNIPKAILSAKAEYGNQMHQMIEDYYSFKSDSFDGATEEQRASLDFMAEFYERNKADEVMCEKCVAYETKYAGKFDMLIHHADGTYELVDIKTTAKYDPEYLSWQLSLYELAIEKTMDIGTAIPIHLKCLWVPKGIRPQLIDVKRKPWDKCLAKVGDYYASQEEDDYPF